MATVFCLLTAFVFGVILGIGGLTFDMWQFWVACLSFNAFQVIFWMRVFDE